MHAVYKRILHQLLVIIHLWIVCCSVVLCASTNKNITMQTSTIIVLACLVATVAAYTHFESPAVDAVHIPDDAYGAYDTPVHERSARTKRGLLLLKKKLLLGALGLKAAKVGAVGAAGVAGALALKKKQAAHSTAHVVTASKHYGYSRWH